MKTFIFSYKFIFMTLISLPLEMCSSDDNNETETSFESVTIDLTSVDVALEDISFNANGYQFKAIRAKTEAGGVILAYPNSGGEFSSIELNLMNSTGLSKISISLFNNCNSCLDIQVLNENQTVTEIKGTELDSGENLVEIDINSAITALRIGSLETVVYTIKLE